MLKIQPVLLVVVALVLLAGCGAAGSAQVTTGSGQPGVTPFAAVTMASPTAEPPQASQPATQPAADSPAAAPAVVASPVAASPAPTSPAATAAAGAPATDGSAVASGTIRLTLQPDSQVSYRVREQLARLNMPSDAVGTTKAVTGTVVLQPDGQILSDQSKFVVDLGTLASDSGMRDGYIKRNTLQTQTYPQAVFVPTEVQELPSPLPTSGDVSFKLVGDLTVRGVTKQVTWDVTGKIAGNDLTGTAKTAVKFEDFGMAPPQTMMVLSVEDNIGLEAAFHLTAGQ